MTRRNRSRGMPRRTSRPERGATRPLLLAAAGVAALMIVAAVAALAIASPRSGVAEPAEQPVIVSGEALPPLPASGADPAVGRRLPTLSGIGVDGEPLVIGLDDGPMAIVILAYWCPHCQAELPGLVELLRSRGVASGTSVLGLSTGIDPLRPNYPPSAWLERERWAEPTLVDDADDSALRALGMSSFPGFVFVDANGAVVLRLTGEIGAERFGQILTTLAP